MRETFLRKIYRLFSRKCFRLDKLLLCQSRFRLQFQRHYLHERKSQIFQQNVCKQMTMLFKGFGEHDEDNNGNILVAIKCGDSEEVFLSTFYGIENLPSNKNKRTNSSSVMFLRMSNKTYLFASWNRKIKTLHECRTTHSS